MNIFWIDPEKEMPNEDESVLGLFNGNDVCEFLVEQVSLFEGRFYLDRDNGLIDYGDAVNPKMWARIK